MATAADAMGDVITTAATILSLLFFKLTGINIDGFVGLGVALVVMWAGFGIARDTLEPLVGEAVTPEDTGGFPVLWKNTMGLWEVTI